MEWGRHTERGLAAQLTNKFASPGSIEFLLQNVLRPPIQYVLNPRERGAGSFHLYRARATLE